MSAKKSVQRVRRAKRQVKIQDSNKSDKLVRVPPEYFLDGYYYGRLYTHTVVAASLANALVFE